MDFSKEEPTLPSDSDDSDEDYVPSGAESNPPSEVESDCEEEEPPDSDAETKTTRKRKLTRGNVRQGAGKGKKGRKSQQNIISDTPKEEDGTEQCVQECSEEEKKKRADSLWADFKKDTSVLSPPPSKPVLSNGNTNKGQECVEEMREPEKKDEKENKTTVTKVFEFAGEEVRVTKKVETDSPHTRVSEAPSSSAGRGRGGGRGRLSGGLSSLLGQLGKKPKLGTLEKSKLDWDRFKKSEGIEDELKTFNRGKDGYLDKQDFLQRADVRQFEIEKSLRSNRRSNR